MPAVREEFHDNGRKLSAILTEMKEELIDFVQTRIAIFKTEVKEKLEAAKVAGPLALVAILLLGTAYLLFTAALVGLVAAFFVSSPYRWCFACLAVAILWTLLGAVAAYFVKRELELKSLMPKRTIEVLKGDKVWIQSEVKNQI